MESLVGGAVQFGAAAYGLKEVFQMVLVDGLIGYDGQPVGGERGSLAGVDLGAGLGGGGGVGAQVVFLHPLFPRRCVRFAVDGGERGIFGHAQGALGAHKLLEVATAGTGGGLNLVERPRGALGKGEFIDDHGVVEPLVVLVVVAPAAGYYGGGQAPEEPVKDIDLVCAEVG